MFDASRTLSLIGCLISAQALSTSDERAREGGRQSPGASSARQTGCPDGCASSACTYDADRNYFTCQACSNNWVLADDGSCVNAPGYFFDATNRAVQPCPPNTFSPGRLRQPSCTPCPGSTVTQPASPQASRTSSAACLLPPGFFRMLRSQPVTTTSSLLPQQVDSTRNTSTADVRQMQQVPTPCPSGYYCPGGMQAGSAGKIPCPQRLWTQATGAVSIDQCLVPPGHYLAGTGDEAVVQQCPGGDQRQGIAGSYYPDWRAPTETTASTCIRCGDGILASALQPLQLFLLQDDGSLKATAVNVSRGAASCYILPGTGMQLDASAQPAPDGTPAFKAVVCNSNNYGLPEPSYGLRVQPCRQCQPGMVTEDKYKSNITGGYYDPAACMVPLGHYYNGQTAVPCPKGQWNDRAPPATDTCKFCSPGTTTFGNSKAATSRAKCSWVQPGWGYSASRVLFKCPQDTFSASERRLSARVSGACTPCPGNRSTAGEGARNAADCINCQPGAGTSNTGKHRVPPILSNASCSLCASGFFGPVQRRNGDTACYTCRLNTISRFDYDGDSNTYQPVSISVPGASSGAACLPEFAAAQDPNWWLPTTASMVNASAAVRSNMNRAEALEACVEACRRAGDRCQFISYDYSSRRCLLRLAAAVPNPTFRVAYKLASDSLTPTSVALPSDTASLPSSDARLPATAAASADAQLPAPSLSSSDTAQPAALASRTPPLTDTPTSQEVREASSASQHATSVSIASLGSGLYSWWADSSAAAGVGLPLSSFAAGISTSDCLAACTKDPRCALVYFVFAGDGSSNVVRCALKQGASSYTNTVRTLLRTKLSALDGDAF